MKKLSLLLFSLTILLTFIGGGITTVLASNDETNYSGEEIYKAYYFGQGELGSQLNIKEKMNFL
ncbi:hypothetical protein I7830_05280 [Mammaliicoccus sciuri]|uniref:hypothetical protein n=1 Tax=Mammaliicoccus sciuri TaxID=1296 RepID=UPI0018DDA993|nr:hypothetical protein [Mammaliicoccus sciuri]QPW15683.1 hypothetical protein I7830_05280 [Mammaliicoccus sciuri]